MDSGFRKEAQSYKELGFVMKDGRQIVRHILAAYRINILLASAVSVSCFQKHSAIIPSRGFSVKPSKTNRSFRDCWASSLCQVLSRFHKYEPNPMLKT